MHHMKMIPHTYINTHTITKDVSWDKQSGSASALLRYSENLEHAVSWLLFSLSVSLILFEPVSHSINLSYCLSVSMSISPQCDGAIRKSAHSERRRIGSEEKHKVKGHFSLHLKQTGFIYIFFTGC